MVEKSSGYLKLVLEVGCGNSRLGEDLLWAGVACGVTCIDLSPVAVQRMCDSLAELGTSGVVVMVVDVLDLPFDSESFDLRERDHVSQPEYIFTAAMAPCLVSSSGHEFQFKQNPAILTAPLPTGKVRTGRSLVKIHALLLLGSVYVHAWWVLPRAAPPSNTFLWRMRGPAS